MHPLHAKAPPPLSRGAVLRRVLVRSTLSLCLVLGVLLAAAFALPAPASAPAPVEPTPDGTQPRAAPITAEPVEAPPPAASGEADPVGWLLPLGLAAVGGLLHEVVQSGGVIVLPRKSKSGQLHLGTLTGALVGAMGGAGVLYAADAVNPFLAIASGFGTKSSLEAVAKVPRVLHGAREALTEQAA